MEEKYTWNLTDIFKTKEEFEKEIEKLNKMLNEIKTYQGKLFNSSENIYQCYRNYEKALEYYEKIYAYGMLKFHLDMANSENIKLFKRCEGIGTEFEMTTSFITPEITDIDTDLLLKYLDENNELKRYERLIKEIIENKPHILSKEEENILANYSEVFNSSKNAFEILTNTEFKFGIIELKDGKKVELTDSNYTEFMKNQDEDIRKKAFNMYREKYKEFCGTISELYLSKVRENVITARLRKYSSALEMEVFKDDSNLDVYNNLVEAVNQNLNANHQFTSLKKKLLKKEEFHIYDMFLNPFEREKDNISFEEAKEQVLNALSVMGEEYTNRIKFAFDNGWLDLYPSENKYNGAYNASVYGVHPYVLCNYINQKRDVSAIAHEFGHAMHSCYASDNQNVIDANYTTLFTQTMFAEFEKEIHFKVEKGETLSAEDISDVYYRLKVKYTGKDCIIDKNARYEWAYIPHFYTPFYVYKYATGVSAAIIIATNILAEKEGYVEKYKNMLKQGCTKKAVELLKMVDVDLEDINTYKGAINFYRELTKELKKLI